MAKKPTIQSASAPVEAAPAVAAIAPIKAVHQIVYGDAQIAVPASIFTPDTAEARQELLAMGAAVELSEAETTVFGVTAAVAPVTVVVEESEIEPAAEAEPEADKVDEDF